MKCEEIEGESKRLDVRKEVEGKVGRSDG